LLIFLADDYNDILERKVLVVGSSRWVFGERRRRKRRCRCGW
jgi:hypothetical protein